MLERNLREAKDGMQAFGLLTLAVLRDEMLYLAQAGAARSLVIKTIDVQENFNSSANVRGLGAASSTNLRLYQSSIQAGDVLLFSANPPAGWNAGTLAGSAQLTLEHLRRRLLTQAEPDSAALVFKFQSGKGELHPLRLRPASVPAGEPAPTLPPLKHPTRRALFLPRPRWRLYFRLPPHPRVGRNLPGQRLSSSSPSPRPRAG